MSMRFGSRFTLSALAAAAAFVAAAPALAQSSAAADQDKDAPRAAEDKVRLGTIVVVGEGNKLGAGQILKEDAPKSRSTVTRAATEKDRATGNSYQALSQLPGINTFNHDATGLFGGGLTVRGFNSDQLGFTINGVPVNDSGNFAVFPQEYADQENLCTQSVTQGSPDVESPHAGATGGNVTVTSCDPEKERRVRASQTLGGLHLTRSFVRYDTGLFADNKARFFLSYSHSQADKWKGKGQAKRDHIDAAFRLDLTPDDVILGSVLYNRAINNNFLAMSLAQYQANGYFFDFSQTFPGHITPVKGTAQDESKTAPNPAYYQLSLNPFENAIVSVSGSFKLAENTKLKVQPYLWYGFGTGGTQQRAQSEKGFLDVTTGKVTAGVDLNGDGDTLDTVIVGRSSVTRTQRPGVTVEVNTNVGDHAIRGGIWYERAKHRQTQPLVPVGADGQLSTVWFNDDLIKRPDGSLYQGRDWDTISTAYQAYVSDNISLMNDQLSFTVGLRTPHVTRDVTNFANESFATTYQLKKTYGTVLPQAGVRFNLSRESQVYLNVAKNFRAPPNFAFTGTNVALVNGAVQLVREAKPEYSVMTDIGYRLQTRDYTLSATAFNADFKDRQANAFDSATLTSTYQNIGRVNNRGLELEVGTAQVDGFSVYGSLTYQRSRVLDDYVASKTVTLPTTGLRMPLTPNMLAAMALQYSKGSYFVRLKGKYTGAQYTTFLNDDQVPSYVVADLDAGYSFGTVGVLSNVQLKLNVSNIGNERYRNPNGGTTVNAAPFTTATGTLAAGTPTYYFGAPRFVSMTLSADFK